MSPLGRGAPLPALVVPDKPPLHPSARAQVYEEVLDCKAAMEKVNGFHLQDRYIVRESRRRARALLPLPPLLVRAR